MTAFAYRAATAAGRIVRGVDDAATPAEVERTLAGRGLYPLEVAPATGAVRRRGRRSRRADTVEAVRHLATLLEADFPLEQALGTVAGIAAHPEVEEALRAVRARLRGGVPLAVAMGERPRVFSQLAVGMARAGERGGHLARALERLAAQLEREQALRSRLAGVMLYPAVMLVVGLAAVTVLLLYVLPRLVGILGEAGVAVPRSTAALMALAAFLAQAWPVMLGAAVAGLAALAAAYGSEAGRLAIDRALLRLPLVGELRRRLASARLGQTLATLLGSGFPVLPALEIAASALSDRAAAAELAQAREEVRAGGRLAAALGRGHAFAFLFLQMVDVGERGGRLPPMLERAAGAMQQEAEQQMERLVRLAEPALILLFGGAVGFVAIALLQAIYGVHAHAL